MSTAIETERLRLRPLAACDFDAWAAFLADPEAMRLLHTPDPVTDPEHARESLERWIGIFADGIGMYTLTVRATGETAGFVGFTPRDHPWGRELELGWLLLPAFWGRGYATEAARVLRPLADERVVSMIRVENEPSANVARKLGMTIEREVDDYHGYRTHVWVSPEP